MKSFICSCHQIADQAEAPPKGTRCRTVLVYQGQLDANIPDEDFFDNLVPFERLFEA